jgi:imidazole glycerol-phosphate synthase subunit HisH
MKKIGIIDIGSGNLYSLIRCLTDLNVHYEIIDDPNKLKGSDAVIIPGVGSFHQGIHSIRKLNLLNSLIKYKSSGKGILGICLGMQLLMSESLEFGRNPGLNFISGIVKPIKFTKGWPVPNIGWSSLNIKNNKKPKLLNDISNDTDFYFVHSYFCDPLDKSQIIAEIRYGNTNIPVIINSENVYGFQFHPELSDTSGYKLISNFIDLT